MERTYYGIPGSELDKKRVLFTYKTATDKHFDTVICDSATNFWVTRFKCKTLEIAPEILKQFERFDVMAYLQYPSNSDEINRYSKLYAHYGRVIDPNETVRWFKAYLLTHLTPKRVRHTYK